MVLTIKPTPKDHPYWLINDFAYYVYKELCSGDSSPDPEQHWESWLANKLGREHEKLLEENKTEVALEYEVMMTKEHLKYRRRMILCSILVSFLFLLAAILFTIDISMSNHHIRIL